VDGSSGGVVSVTDPRWDKRSEILSGAKDLFGNRGIKGPENALLKDTRFGVRNG